MATLHRQYVTLGKLHQRQSTHKSHGAFIFSCFHNHVIPQGLKIKTSPSVPKINILQRTLQKKWRAILNRTCYTLLKLLKRYYQDAITTLTNEINNLVTRLCEDSGFTASLEGRIILCLGVFVASALYSVHCVPMPRCM